MDLKNYKFGFALPELLTANIPGFHIYEESFAVGMSKQVLETRIGKLPDSGIEDAAVTEIYTPFKDTGMDAKNLIERLNENYNLNKDVIKIGYKPFDNRFCFYNNAIADPLETELKKPPRGNINFFLNTVGQAASPRWSHVFITRYPSPDFFLEESNTTYVFPLNYYNSGKIGNSKKGTGSFNLNEKIIQQISVKTGLTFILNEEPEGNVCMAANSEVRPDFKITFTLEDVADYIYAVLHSPTYRDKNNEFLKNDFPRIPYPEDNFEFWNLVELGAELKKTHLLESPKVFELAASYLINRNTETEPEFYIGTVKWEVSDSDSSTGRVWINDSNYFNKVPRVAWNFYVGGYQPAKKWITDRSGHSLTPGEIIHYQCIIAALSETHRLMQEIDKIIF